METNSIQNNNPIDRAVVQYKKLKQMYNIFQNQQNLSEKKEIIWKIKDWDIIFQTSKSRQSQAIQNATQSNISHVWIILNHRWSWQVLEAVQPVKYTPLQSRIQRWSGSDFTIKRVLHQVSWISQFKDQASKYLWKPYDGMFWLWNDAIYCSELVYKLYESVWIKLWKMQKIWDLDFNNKATQELFFYRLWIKWSNEDLKDLQILLKKYKTPNNVLRSPDAETFKKNLSIKVLSVLDQPLITPIALFDDDQLQTIHSSYSSIEKLQH